VVYYYEKANAQLDSSISITGPDEVGSKTATINYAINYQVKITDYVGDVKITIVDKLQYPIEESQSNLDGGSYDASALTITWIETLNDLNTYYANGTASLSYSHDIAIVYSGAKANDEIANTVSGSVEIDDANHDSSASTMTKVRTPATIIYQHVDTDGNALIDDYTDDGYVEEASDYTAPEIDGYTITNPDATDVTLTEESQTIKLIYKKNSEETPAKDVDPASTEETTTKDVDPVSTEDTLNPIKITMTVLGSVLACLGIRIINRRRS